MSITEERAALRNSQAMQAAAYATIKVVNATAYRDVRVSREGLVDIAEHAQDLDELADAFPEGPINAAIVEAAKHLQLAFWLQNAVVECCMDAAKVVRVDNQRHE